ncbi:hypothetical protein ACQ0MK_13700 [Thalassospira lucentensis]|uniref:hypothetical protein n=1 Tax=Thalassospira lucentensis TaxID=168935 RepID=UPI003D2EFBF2
MKYCNFSRMLSGVLLPAMLTAAVLLAAFVAPVKADVYSPNGVLLSSAEWKDASTDGKNVTVRDALTNAGNAMITNGVKGVKGYTLTVMSFWDSSPSGDTLVIEVRKDGSVQGTCDVTSTKTGNTFDTTC